MRGRRRHWSRWRHLRGDHIASDRMMTYHMAVYHGISQARGPVTAN
jgi:hypothetical protein